MKKTNASSKSNELISVLTPHFKGKIICLSFCFPISFFVFLNYEINRIHKALS